MPPLKQSAKALNGPSRHISLYGEDFFNPTKHYSFNVPCGDQPPTVVGGYANWNTLARPLRRSLTIFQGYDPTSLQVSVRFIKFDDRGSWLTDDDAGRAIEYEIAILEWMAGESITTGPSPLVWLATFDGRGNTVPLIPFEYQADTGSVIGEGTTFLKFNGGDVAPWVITGGIQWDAAPIRNPNGFRIRQEAQFTVQYYQSTGGDQSRNPTSQNGKSVTFVSRNGADTAVTIARAIGSRDVGALANAIKAFPQNSKLGIRSIYHTHIKHGKKVHVPLNYTSGG